MSANGRLISRLVNAQTEAEKINAMSDEDFVFHFMNATKEGVGNGGYLLPATRQSYPALMTANGAMVVGVMGPCGLNTPHTHPRATEMLLVSSGGPIQSSMIMENGARMVQNIVEVGSATVYPQGSFHYQQNLGCDPAVFVSSFDYSDPGTGQIAHALFGFNPSACDSCSDTSVSLVLPALGVQECLDRCHIDRNTYNFTTAFGDYMAFSNSTWAVPSALPASVSSAYMSKPTGGALKAVYVNQGTPPTNVPFDHNPLKSTVIGLGAASAVLMLACVGLLLIVCVWRRRTIATYAAPLPITSYTYTTPCDDTERLTGMHTPLKAES